MRLFEASDVFDYPWSSISFGVWSKYPNENSPQVMSVDTLTRTLNPQSGLLRTERLIGCQQSAPAWVMRLVGSTGETYVREVSVVDPADAHLHSGGSRVVPRAGRTDNMIDELHEDDDEEEEDNDQRNGDHNAWHVSGGWFSRRRRTRLGSTAISNASSSSSSQNSSASTFPNTNTSLYKEVWDRSLSGPASEIPATPAPSPSVTMRSINLSLRSLLEVQEVISYRPHPDPQFAATHTLFEQSAQIKAYGFFSKLARKIESAAYERFGENAERGRQGFNEVLEKLFGSDDPKQNSEGTTASASSAAA